MDGNRPLTGQAYYSLVDNVRTEIKTALQNIYKAHLRRNELTEGEKHVLNTAIPILLSEIQGKFCGNCRFPPFPLIRTR